MGCSGCGQKYRGLQQQRRSSSIGSASPPAIARDRKRPLFKKGRRIYYEDERQPVAASVEVVTTPSIEEVKPETTNSEENT